MLKAFKYWPSPNRAQTAKLNQTLATCHELYNAALEQRRTAYRTQRKSVSAAQQMRELPDLKTALPEVGAVYSQVLQRHAVARGFSVPKLLSPGQISERQSGLSALSGSSHLRFVYLPADGLCQPARAVVSLQDRQPQNQVALPHRRHGQACALKREVGEWDVVFACEFPDVEPLEPRSAVGIDVGLESFIATSDG